MQSSHFLRSVFFSALLAVSVFLFPTSVAHAFININFNFNFDISSFAGMTSLVPSFSLVAPLSDSLVTASTCASTLADGSSACVSNGSSCVSGISGGPGQTVPMNQSGTFCSSVSPADSQSSGATVVFNLSETLQGVTGSALILIPQNQILGIRTQAQANIALTGDYSQAPDAKNRPDVSVCTIPTSSAGAAYKISIPDVSQNYDDSGYSANYTYCNNGSKELSVNVTYAAHYEASTKTLVVTNTKGGRFKKQSSWLSQFGSPAGWTAQKELGYLNAKVWSQIRVIRQTPRPPTVPTADLSVASRSIKSGESTMISWNCQNSNRAESINFSGDGQMIGSIPISPTVTTTYTLNCLKSGGVTMSTKESDPKKADGGLVAGDSIATDTETVTVLPPSTLPVPVPDAGGSGTATGGNGTPTQIDIGTGPFSPTRADVGVETSFSAPIENRGAAISTSFPNTFFVDGDTDHSAYYGTYSATLPSLAQAGTATVRTAITFPTVGTWYVRFCADMNSAWVGVVPEVNEENNCSAWTSVDVAVPAPVATLTATPSTISYKDSSTLTWRADNSTSCTGNAFETEGKTVGSVQVSPIATQLYTLDCINGAGVHGYSNQTVIVTPAQPRVTANPALVRAGDPATISWSVVGKADSCTIAGPGLSSRTSVGSQQVTVREESTYTMTCVSGRTSASESVTVKILPNFREN